jgi:hypothetical protein
MRYNESAIQRSLMTWWSVAHRSLGVPHDALFAIPNGGARSPITGAILKAEGVRPGVPDLFLSCPRGGYAGLFIELKTLTGRVRPEQSAWMAGAIVRGYWAVVARGWDQARAEIESYLKGAK